MTQQQFFFGGNRRNGWYGLVIMAIVLILLFFLVKSLFKILYWLSPILLILTILFDYKVIIKYVKWVVKMAKSNLLYAIVVVILSVVAFPILSGGLFVNAFMNWRLKRARKKAGIPTEEEKRKFTDFELLENEPLDLDDNTEA